MTLADSNPKLVPAVDRAARILDLVARNRTYPSLSELSRELNIAKSSVHTLCNTLVHLELLIRRPDQTFGLGPHVMRWSNAFTQQSDVATEFATIWDHETELPGATITLTVLEGAEVVYIAARNSAVSHSLIDFRAGMRLPAAFTATGKAFLSHMSDFEVKRLYADGLPAPRTPHSVQTIDKLLAELKEIRRNGYSCDDEQVAEGIVCYGASVLDSQNRPLAGVAVSLLAEKLSEADTRRIIGNVQRIAARLSQRMGADLSVATAGDIGNSFEDA
ncbi:MAG: IclR family transcriptional regulator [Alphaproteobacteria bacterium]|nr:IclR family transcriptional regulator [Alphaproteobacteria bacterium]MBU0804210.1 IclR family transcriptional regulator [Alphaproteobacteria bacterium]MBU0871041.1 IclR family transcriptional regulator [Alphaproteobacteria bacterium]MBU1400796.1 IclR family transcriptional regulator [Alphaproteobacteria bacterium]MBU1592787.1 IclR family transcriptional regulator [Alphaproteobacteria bacterium]